MEFAYHHIDAANNDDERPPPTRMGTTHYIILSPLFTVHHLHRIPHIHNSHRRDVSFLSTSLSVTPATTEGAAPDKIINAQVVKKKCRRQQPIVIVKSHVAVYCVCTVSAVCKARHIRPCKVLASQVCVGMSTCRL